MPIEVLFIIVEINYSSSKCGNILIIYELMMDEQKVVCPYDGISFSCEKEWSTDKMNLENSVSERSHIRKALCCMISYDMSRKDKSMETESSL